MVKGPGRRQRQDEGLVEARPEALGGKLAGRVFGEQVQPGAEEGKAREQGPEVMAVALRSGLAAKEAEFVPEPAEPAVE